MSQKYIVIEADTNDADYTSRKSPITDEQIEQIRPVVEAIKKFKPYKAKSQKSDLEWTHDNNFPIGECLRKDLGEKSIYELYGGIKGLHLFKDLVPYNEYGIHTIVSVDIVSEGEKLM